MPAAKADLLGVDESGLPLRIGVVQVEVVMIGIFRPEALDVLIQAAAPADYRFAEISPRKLKKKQGEPLTFTLVENPDVAAAVGMSNSRFSTVFAQESGKTFTEYLTWLRIERAKELLQSSEKRSSQIALEIGYNDSHYFSYLFKKNVGMTPGEYRSEKQGGG